jgi:hypothetical protein
MPGTESRHFLALSAVFGRLTALVFRLACGHDAPQRAGRISPKRNPSR